VPPPHYYLHFKANAAHPNTSALQALYSAGQFYYKHASISAVARTTNKAMMNKDFILTIILLMIYLFVDDVI